MNVLEDVKAIFNGDTESSTAAVVALLGALAAIEKYLKPLKVLWRAIRNFFLFFKRFADSVEKIENVSRDIQYLIESRNIDVEMSDIGIFRCDSDGSNYDVNTAYCNALGCTKEQLMGKNWKYYVDDEEYEDKWKWAFENKSSLTTKVKFIAVNGTEVHGMVKILPVNDGFEGRIRFE